MYLRVLQHHIKQLNKCLQRVPAFLLSSGAIVRCFDLPCFVGLRPGVRAGMNQAASLEPGV